MRPWGVTAIAILTWIRGALYALAGLAILGIGHLSARMMAPVTGEASLQNVVVGLGKVLGIGALLVAVAYVVVGVGLWGLNRWARVLPLFFVGLAFLLGMIGLVRHPTAWQLVRMLVEVAILVYLMLPNVKCLFAAA
jgi:uncharacterized membrane protein (DUF2068 family)